MLSSEVKNVSKEFMTRLDAACKLGSGFGSLLDHIQYVIFALDYSVMMVKTFQWTDSPRSREDSVWIA
jgi:hypothetical protein